MRIPGCQLVFCLFTFKRVTIQLNYICLIPYYTFSGEGSSFLTFQKGDLIVLDDDSTGETVMNSGWCIGRCERTGQKGDFPAEAVYVLPALSQPPHDILVIDWVIFYLFIYLLFFIMNHCNQPIKTKGYFVIKPQNLGFYISKYIENSKFKNPSVRRFSP